MPNVKYFFGKEFKDFAKIDWKEQNVEPAETLVLIDDHQSAFRRLKEAVGLGFRHVMFEDNFFYMQGDNYALKWVCHRDDRYMWKGWVPDNFRRQNVSKSWEEHVQDGDELSRLLKSYYEFPPIVNPWLIQSTRLSVKRVTPPLVNTMKEYRNLNLGKYGGREFDQYTFFAIVEANS